MPARAAGVNTFRAWSKQCDLIDKAAKLLDRNRSDFMPEATCDITSSVTEDAQITVKDINYLPLPTKHLIRRVCLKSVLGSYEGLENL